MTPSELLEKRIKDLDDPLRSEASWRGDVVAKLRDIIQEADPEMTLDWKWDTANRN